MSFTATFCSWDKISARKMVVYEEDENCKGIIRKKKKLHVWSYINKNILLEEFHCNLWLMGQDICKKDGGL
jgi:hypothetical protein